jgi:Lon protease-like protein
MSSTLSATAFAPSALPEILPIFPLSGVVLLPRARLPLHIFEPRYLAMIDDVLATQGRMVGMVQPTADADDKSGDAPPVYSVGCAGRVTSFAETEDGRLMVGLTGLCRFEIGEELQRPNPYRRVRPNWEKFQADLDASPDVAIDHERLSAILQPYFKAQSIETDWTAIQGMSDESLISTLAMICPLAPNEKQALLEAPDLAARAAMLMTLLEMASLPPGEGNVRH